MAQETFNNLTMSKDDLRVLLETAVTIALNLSNRCGGDGRLKNASPNPFYNVVKDDGGLAIIEYYSTPSVVATPLGGISIHTSCAVIESQGWQEYAQGKWGLYPLKPFGEENPKEEMCWGPLVREIGCIGPAWSVGDNPATLLANRENFFVGWVVVYPLVDYHTANDLWEELKPKHLLS